MVTLGDVMSRRVVTIAETKTAREAARAMKRNKIGSVVVSRKRQVIGIITERDILTMVASGKNPDKLRVGDLMSKPVIVGEETADLQQAIKVMVLHGIKKLPILRGKKLIGIVTLTDFARVGPIVQDMMAKALHDADEKQKRQVARAWKKYAAQKEPPPNIYV